MLSSSLCLCDILTQTTKWSSFCFVVYLQKIPQERKYFQKVGLFFIEHQLERSNCVPVYTDGAQSMMGSKWGFEFRKKGKTKIFQWFIVFSKEKSCSKRNTKNLAIVFKEVVSVVNYIKSAPCTLIYFVSCVANWMQNTMGFCFNQTFVGYREERCWREWLTYETKLSFFKRTIG